MSSEFGTDPERPSGSGVARSGLWLFAPVAMVLFLALRERVLPAGDAVSRSAPVAPGSLGELVPLEGFVWRLPRPSDGASLLARLEPLHPDPDRQAFDAAVLSERFGLPTGEVSAAEGGAQPWRLTLIAEASPDQGGDDEPEPLLAALSDVTVSGLVPLIPGAADGAADLGPLAAMLGAASQPLRAGERADLIFWGPPPEAPLIAVGELGSVRLLPVMRQVRRRSEAVAWEDGRSPRDPEAIK